jgi:beta-glucosidase
MLHYYNLRLCLLCLQEVYGEDPFLSGLLTAAYVKGMQGPDPRFVRVSSGCKVVGLYSGPEDKPVIRFSFNAVVSISCVILHVLT